MSYAHLAAEFYDHPEQNIARSVQEGRPVYDPVIQVKLKVKGNKDYFSRKVTDENREELMAAFPEAWARYKNGGGGGSVSGTVLTALGLDVAKTKELHAVGIMTIEDLANINDGDALKKSGWMNLKQKAVDWLAAKELTKDGDIVAKLKALEDEVEELKKKKKGLELENGRLKKRADPEAAV